MKNREQGLSQPEEQSERLNANCPSKSLTHSYTMLYLPSYCAQPRREMPKSPRELGEFRGRVTMMNFYLIIILGFLVVDFFLYTCADFLNLRSLPKHFDHGLPQEFQGIYDPKKYSDSLRYQRARMYFELTHRTSSFAVTIPFILLGGFNAVDQLARNPGLSQIPTALIFVGILLSLNFIIELPFSVYDTFVLEEKFGFNKTTPQTFIQDMIKGAVLGSIIGGLIFSAVIYFFEFAGPNA